MKIKNTSTFYTFQGVAMERRSQAVKKRVGKMLVDLFENHKINTPLLPQIEIDTGIVEQTKKYGISTYSLHKYLGSRIFQVPSAGNNKKSIILGTREIQDIQEVINLWLYWKNSQNMKASKQVIECVFSYLFLK